MSPMRSESKTSAVIERIWLPVRLAIYVASFLLFAVLMDVTGVMPGMRASLSESRWLGEAVFKTCLFGLISLGLGWRYRRVPLAFVAAGALGHVLGQLLYLFQSALFWSYPWQDIPQAAPILIGAGFFTGATGSALILATHRAGTGKWWPDR